MIELFISFLNFVLFSPSSKVRLEKVERKSRFEQVCDRACPYIILACLIILGVLLFIVLVKYGHSLSTEANNYYYNMG